MSPQRVAVLTGANGSIGKEISRQIILAEYQKTKSDTTRKDSSLKLILVCRSQDKVKTVQEYLVGSLKNSQSQKISASFSSSDTLNLQFDGYNATVQGELADLSSYQSVQKLIQKIKSKNSKIDILVNNAAVVSDKRQLTEDELELQWQVNVMSYYWLTLGLQTLLNSADPQPSNVVFVASNYAGGLDLSDVNFSNRAYSNSNAYRATKQANRLLARGFASHFSQNGLNIRVNACHPGVTTSTVLQGLGMSQGTDSAADSARQPVFLATSPEIGSGEYYSHMKKVDCPFVKNTSMVSELWSFCHKLTTDLDSKYH